MSRGEKRSNGSNGDGTTTRTPAKRAARISGGSVAEAPEPVLDRRQLLSALQRVRSGDFTAQLPGDWTGMDGKIADTFNEIVAATSSTGYWRRCRWTSNSCWSGCIARMKTWWARRSWWWTTTSAISLPSAVCWSVVGCRC